MGTTRRGRAAAAATRGQGSARTTGAPPRAGRLPPARAAVPRDGAVRRGARLRQHRPSPSWSASTYLQAQLLRALPQQGRVPARDLRHRRHATAPAPGGGPGPGGQLGGTARDLHPHALRRRRRPARRGAAGVRGDGRGRSDRRAALGRRRRAPASSTSSPGSSRPTAPARCPIRSPGRSSERYGGSSTRASSAHARASPCARISPRSCPTCSRGSPATTPHPRGCRCAPARDARAALGARLGGRAPGTLSARALSGGRGLPRGEHNLPRGFVTHNQRERIFDAIANLTATSGYPALSLDEVAAEAAVSLRPSTRIRRQGRGLHRHLRDRPRGPMAVVNQTLVRQKSWIGAVRQGAPHCSSSCLRALCAHLASST